MVEESLTLKIAAQAAALKEEGKPVISLTAGEPDLPPPAHVREAIVDSTDKHTYTATGGIPDLRKAIAEKFRRENGLDYSADEVMAGTGAKGILMAALFALKRKRVLIPMPGWLSYAAQAGLAGIVSIPTTDIERDAQQGDVLIVNTPCNPTGGVLSRAEIERIARIANERDLFIISDEVYEHFLYEGENISIATLPGMRGRTLTVGSCSKTYAMTGWRLGFCGGPKELIADMIAIQSHMTSNPCSLAQYAALAALTGPQESVDTLRETFRARRDAATAILDAAGISYERPQGAFYLFIDISGSRLSSIEYAQRLLAEQLVAVIPGKPFGADTHIRISYATQEIEEGVRRLAAFHSTL